MGEGVSASLSNIVLLIKATLSCKYIVKGVLPCLHYLSFPSRVFFTTTVHAYVVSLKNKTFKTAIYGTCQMNKEWG